MNRLWLYFLPLLFLPNLGMARATPLGVLELTDLLIAPYICLVWFAAAQIPRGRSLIDRVRKPIIIFLALSLLSVILINARYPYDDLYYFEFSLFKLGKFILYGTAGYLTILCARDSGSRRDLMVSLMAAGLVLGISLSLVGQKIQTEPTTIMTEVGDPGMGYKAVNGLSVLGAMMACYFCGVLVTGKELRAWKRWLTVATLVALILGCAISQGRGGWIAGISGVTYLAWRRIRRTEMIMILIFLPLTIYVLYQRVPAFQTRVDATLFAADYDAGGADIRTIDGVDVGGRPQEWKDGLSQFQFFGTGFFHRGGSSGIYQNGSHNFFLQIFLEVGFAGGCLMLYIFYRFWKIAGSVPSKYAQLELPVKAALVATIVGGMGGEYFYGGLTLLGLILLYAACGSLPTITSYGAPYRVIFPDSSRLAPTG